jgi:hypothetical protein
MTQPTTSTGAEFCGRIYSDIAAIWCDVGHDPDAAGRGPSRSLMPALNRHFTTYTLTPDRAAQRQAAE